MRGGGLGKRRCGGRHAQGLREVWMAISPVNYIEKFGRFLGKLWLESAATVIDHDVVVLPCGHYTMGAPSSLWMVYLRRQPAMSSNMGLGGFARAHRSPPDGRLGSQCSSQPGAWYRMPPPRHRSQPGQTGRGAVRSRRRASRTRMPASACAGPRGTA